jgi:hypothetical protein
MSPPFMAYAIVYVIIGIILASLSEKSPGSGAGSRTFAWVCVDVGLCAIFGECPSHLVARYWINLIFLRWLYCVIHKGSLYVACDSGPQSIFSMDRVPSLGCTGRDWCRTNSLS